ncbi:MAG: lipoprotein [Coxiellaceae bacterium]|nr:MAG: lipoprotein [Coxiellaceae bacterium]
MATVVCIAYLLLISGCGQSGPLYLPPKSSQNNQTQTSGK